MVSKKKSEEKSEWLPSGWTEHINVRNGKTTKYFTNVETGQKFGSWKSLNRYLNPQGGISESRIPSIVSTDSGRSDYSSSSLMNEYPEWLPQGWTVETRRRVGSNKHGSVYKVYVEISTGCKLYSKPQVLQYLKKVHLDSSAGKENDVKVNINESDELPPGWIKELRTRKYKGKTKQDPYYTDPVSGYVFRSKLDVLRYLESGEIRKCATKPQKRDANEVKGALSMNEYPEWLPQGWTVETRRRVRSKHGTVYKVYVEISTGCKLYSKPQVLQYLKKVHLDSSAGKENDGVNEHSTGKLTISEPSESVEDKCHISGEKTGPKLTLSEPSESAEDKCHITAEKNGPDNPALEDKVNINESDELPPGWIKELRTRKYKGKTKQDPYYTDPVSGYVFRSKLDVLRYLESGDIRKCATKPQKRDANEVKGALSSPSPANAKKKEQHSASTSQLSAADMADKESEISKEKEADCLPFDSTFKASAVVDVEEQPEDVEASHKYEENSMTINKGFKQESKLFDDNGVSSPALTAHSRKSKRKPPNMPQRSSKRLARGH